MFRVLSVLAAISVALRVGAAEPASVVLPDWYEDNRVQAHSEHSLRFALEMTPEAHSETIKSLGADVLTRVYLTRDEGAWWQSAVGEVSPLIGDREFAREISDAVHAAGLKSIAYHRHMSDAWVQREHPDWLTRLPGGSPMLEPRGKSQTVFVPCMNSPYKDYIETRLVELAERGVDAIYFDNRHMPDVCTCKWCRAKFKEETGRDMNVDSEVGSDEYMEMVDFVNRTMVRVFVEWRAAVRKKYPDVFFVVKSSLYPAFFSPHMDTRLLRVSDVSGTEFSKSFGHNNSAMRDVKDFFAPAFDDQVALGWSIVRDGVQGRPPHMWIPHCRTETEARYSAAASVTYGCIAAMSVPIRELPRDGKAAADIFPSSFAMGDRVSPYMTGARPIPMAALHISERSRNKRVPNMKKIWADVFGPGLGGYRALKEEHVPWVVVSDLDLAEGLDKRTKMLVLPWPGELDDAGRKTVKAFEQSGGTVVRLDPGAGWHLKGSLPGLLKETRRTVHKSAQSMTIRIDGPDPMHAVSFHQKKENRLVVCLANTWGWFRSTRDPDPAINNGTEPPPCSDVTISLTSEWANPRRAFDAVTGTEITVQTGSGGTRIKVPTFQIQSCVVLEF
jgi:hypothetical protein